MFLTWCCSILPCSVVLYIRLVLDSWVSSSNCLVNVHLFNCFGLLGPVWMVGFWLGGIFWEVDLFWICGFQLSQLGLIRKHFWDVKSVLNLWVSGFLFFHPSQGSRDPRETYIHMGKQSNQVGRKPTHARRKPIQMRKEPATYTGSKVRIDTPYHSAFLICWFLLKTDDG